MLSNRALRSHAGRARESARLLSVAIFAVACIIFVESRHCRTDTRRRGVFLRLVLSLRSREDSAVRDVPGSVVLPGGISFEAARWMLHRVYVGIAAIQGLSASRPRERRARPRVLMSGARGGPRSRRFPGTGNEGFRKFDVQPSSWRYSIHQGSRCGLDGWRRNDAGLSYRALVIGFLQNTAECAHHKPPFQERKSVVYRFKCVVSCHRSESLFAVLSLSSSCPNYLTAGVGFASSTGATVRLITPGIYPSTWTSKRIASLRSWYRCSTPSTRGCCRSG